MQISCAVLTWGHDSDIEIGIREASELGYQAFESFNRTPMKYADNPEQFKELSQKYGLPLTSLYVEGELANLEKRDELVDFSIKVAKFLKANDCENLVVGPGRRPDNGPTQEQLKIAAETLTIIAEKCAELGIKMSFHPHLGTEIQNEDEVDAVMDMTDKEKVLFCPDTAQLSKAGMDPVEVMKRYSDRIQYVHLKDFKDNKDVEIEYGNEAEFFCELGLGSIDFEPVIELLRDIDYKGWIAVEVDRPTVGTPKDSHAQCIDFLENTLKLKVRN